MMALWSSEAYFREGRLAWPVAGLELIISLAGMKSGSWDVLGKINLFKGTQGMEVMRATCQTRVDTVARSLMDPGVC